MIQKEGFSLKYEQTDFQTFWKFTLNIVLILIFIHVFLIILILKMVKEVLVQIIFSQANLNHILIKFKNFLKKNIKKFYNKILPSFIFRNY